MGTALVGVRNEQEAMANCAAFDWQLEDDEVALLNAELERLEI